MSATGINSRMGLAEWSMLLLLSMLWGGSYFFVEIALLEWSPLLIVAVRVVIAAAVIWGIVLAIGLPVPRSRSAWIAFFWMGLLNNILPFLLIVWGQKEIESGLAAILTAVAPIFTVIVAGLWLKDEPLTRSKVLGAVLGLVGVVVLIGPSALAGLNVNLIAQLAVLGAALSYAFAGVYARRFPRMNIDPIVTAAGQLLMSSLIMGLLALISEAPGQLVETSAKVWLAIALMAVFSTAFAYILYFRLIASAGATNAILVTLLIPVTAILLGAAFLDERLEWSHFVGMMVIGAGLAVIDGRLWHRFMRPGRPLR